MPSVKPLCALSSRLLVVVLLSMLAAASTQAADKRFIKKTLAVAEFENKVTNATVGNGLTEMLTNALVDTHRFVVLERINLWEVMNEQDLASSDRAAVALKSAQLGKVVPAQLLIIGTITEFGEGAKSGGGGISVMGVRLKSGGSTTKIGLIIRIVDTSTGEVLDSVSVEGEAKGKSSSGSACFAGVCTGGNSSSSENYAGAAEVVITKAVNEIVDRSEGIPFQGKLIRVNGNKIYTDTGKRNGAARGDVFTVYQPGEELVDPDTGESLGSDMTAVGSVRLVDVQEKFGRAVMATGGGFAKGQILKPSALANSGWVAPK